MKNDALIYKCKMLNFENPWPDKEVTMYCITYLFKFVNILRVIYISLFEYNFISLDTTVLRNYFKEKSQCPGSHNHLRKNHFPIQIHPLRRMYSYFFRDNLTYLNQRFDFLFLCCCQLVLVTGGIICGLFFCFCFSDVFFFK